MGLASLVLQMVLDRRTFTEVSLVMAWIAGGVGGGVVSGIDDPI